MIKQPSPDNFEFTFSQDNKGYYSSIDPTIVKGNFLMRGSQNVFKNSNGNLSNRFGRKLVTGEPVDTTIAPVNAAFVWNNSLSKTYSVRIANGVVAIRSDVVTTNTYVWYTLLTVTKTRGVFDAWWDNTDKKDKLIFVIGDSSLYDWSGGITTTLSGTINTITKQGTTTWAQEGFASTGTVTISGVDYVYTGGTTTTTLTGVGTDASALTAGLVAIQKIVTTTNTPASGFSNDFIRVIGNRLHVGSYTSRLIYISKNTSYTNFTVPATRVAGDPELLTLDNASNGIGVRQGKAHISAGTSDWYIISYSEITVGTTVSEQTTVEKQQSSNQAAALAHEFIDMMNDTIIYISKDQQLRAFGTFRNLTTPSYPILSFQVSTELQAVDFTLGQLRAIASGDLGDLIYITSPNSGVTYIYQVKTSVNALGNIITERLWWSPFVWGLSRIDVIAGITVGFSNSNPQTYLLWNTNQWVDDLPSETAPFVSIALWPYQSYNRRQGKFKFDKVYWEGYMTEGTVLLGGVYYDYQGASGTLSVIIHDSVNSPANSQSFFTGVIPPSLGDASLGDNPLGSPTATVGIGNTTLSDHDLLSKFKIITGVQMIESFEYAIMAYSQSKDARWEIIATATNPSVSSSQAVEIIKKTS